MGIGNSKILAGGIAILALGIILLGWLVYQNRGQIPDGTPPPPPLSPPSALPSVEELEGVSKFATEQEFKDYLSETGSLLYSGGFRLGDVQRSIAIDGVAEVGPVAISAPNALGGASMSPDRVSGTNVQVQGIDEPDIVKTNGEEIYFSPQSFYYGFREPAPFLESDVRGIAPPQQQVSTKILDAFPPADVTVKSEIDKSGQLLLEGDTLVVFSDREYPGKVYGYDVADPLAPVEMWTMDLEDSTSIVQSRLTNGKIYMVTRTVVNRSRPCPFIPITVSGTQLSIPCHNIYYPSKSSPVDSTFVAMVVNPKTGDVEEQVSFVGSSGQSVVYMSPSAIYLTYTYFQSEIDFAIDFLTSEGSDLFPPEIADRLGELDTLSISNQAKLVEFEVILEEYMLSIDKDEVLRLTSEIENRYVEYAKRNLREFQKTGIVRIRVNGFGVEATGEVPGIPLNQFALDEYEGHLRIATTSGDRFGFGRGTESVNDVYVLNTDLKLQGSVKDLGIGERIFAVRFLGNKGYVVTFRQIDPFYVLDLADPKNPVAAGELKIPGFSSYLHPIDQNTILGIGQEDRRVKLSMFNVASPSNPVEDSKYILDEGWTEVQNNHHAFLLDAKHNVFFLPGSKGGYIFKYDSGKITLQKAVKQQQVKRALFLDDYLYIIGETQIVILNENTWERVNEVDLN
jgi:inhibitor of cysteine peptidase